MRGDLEGEFVKGVEGYWEENIKNLKGVNIFLKNG
jgi:hypothetical protein